MTADEREGKIAETFLVSSKHNPKTKRLTERKNLTKNLQNATTKSYTAKGKSKSQNLQTEQQSYDSLKHQKKKSSKICKTQQETHAPKERTKKGSHKCTMQQICSNPKDKNQAHKPDKRMQQIMQPRGEEKPPFTSLQNATL
jgi:hypothetical protein